MRQERWRDESPVPERTGPERTIKKVAGQARHRSRIPLDGTGYSVRLMALPGRPIEV